MKKIICCIVFCVLVVCIPAASYASLNQFDGYWKNSDPDTRGLTKLKINVTGTNVTVQAWGKCHPSDCDMGTVTAYAYAPNVSANLAAEADALTAIFNENFKQTIIVIRPYGNNQLKVNTFDHFTDNSNRTDYNSTYVLKKALTLEPAGREDCISYDPRNLRIENEGATGWLLTDGHSRMLTLDNESDARKALALAKRYTKQCFIGRDNRRPNRKDYIVEYWSGPSGIRTDLGREDCIAYNPRNLRIVNEGAAGWLLTDGRSRMLTLDNESDARKALDLAKRYTKQCFIGRNNHRPNRKDYIVGYWK